MMFRGLRNAGLLLAIAWAVTWLGANAAVAHELRPAYLEMKEIRPEVFQVFWKVPALGDEARLGLYLKFEEDVKYLDVPVARFVADAHVQQFEISRDGGLEGTRVTIDGLAGTFTDVLLRIDYLDGAVTSLRLKGDQPYFVVEPSPGLWQVGWDYFVLGVEHIWFGIDHLLFVVALLLIVKDVRRLVETITAFTLAHSVTLVAAALGWVNVPGPPVEAIIALSIVFVAAEIVRSSREQVGLTERWPWIVSLTFGLLHGFGFAGALSEIGLPQNAIPIALLTFNLGVEAGQLMFVAGWLLGGWILRRATSSFLGEGSLRWWNSALAYGIGGIAAFWVVERVVGFWA